MTRRGQRGSWQSRLLNAVLRLQRVDLRHEGHIRALRGRVERLDQWRGRLLAPCLRFRRVVLGGVPADRVQPGRGPGRRHLLYLHGGAFCFHSPWLYRGLVMDLCRRSGTVGLIPDYRLAPEHPFPAALEDSLACYRALLAQGVEPGDIVLGGDSAGGQLALALLIRARDEGLPLPACAVLVSTGGDWTLSGASFGDNAASDAMFRMESLMFLREIYLRGQPADDPLASPMFADLSGLPPLYLVASQDELMRDVSVGIASRARQAGGSAELRLWNDQCHAFPLFAFLPESARARAEIAAFIRRHLPRSTGATQAAGRLDQAPAYSFMQQV